MNNKSLINNYAIYSLEFNNFDIYIVFYVFSLYDEFLYVKLKIDLLSNLNSL